MHSLLVALVIYETGTLLPANSLRLYSFASSKCLHVLLCNGGGCVDADVEVWHGARVPFKVRVFADNGRIRPFGFVVNTPSPANTIAIRNLGSDETLTPRVWKGISTDEAAIPHTVSFYTVSSGAVKTIPIDAAAEAMEVRLYTKEGPLNARVELLQGTDGSNKQVVQLFTEDGADRPFSGHWVIPQGDNKMRIVNTAAGGELWVVMGAIA